MSFFLVKLIQNFSSFSLATDVQPRDSIRAPTAADTPSSEVEKRIFGVHLTMYFKVRFPSNSLSFDTHHFCN